CSNCTASACFSVPSKTASPVVLTKSASKTLSFSVSFEDCLDRRYNPPAISAASTTSAAGARIFQGFFGGMAPIGATPAGAALTALTAPEDAAATLDEP